MGEGDRPGMPDADGERDPFVPRESGGQPPREPSPEPVPDAVAGLPSKPARRYAPGLVWLGIVVGLVGGALIASAIAGLGDGGPVVGWLSLLLVVAAIVVPGILLVRSADRARRSWGMGLLISVPAALIVAPVIGLVACLVLLGSSGL